MNASQLARSAKKHLDEGDQSYEKAAEEMWELRTEHGWTFLQIAEAVGRGETTVREHIAAYARTARKPTESFRVKSDEQLVRNEASAARRAIRDTTPSVIASELLSDPKIRKQLQKAQDIAADKVVREAKKAERAALGGEVVDRMTTTQLLRDAEGELFKARRALIRTLQILNTSAAESLDDSWREELMRTFEDIAEKADMGRNLLAGDITDELEKMLAKEGAR